MVLLICYMICYKNVWCKNVIGDYKCWCNWGFEGDGVVKCICKYLVYLGSI